MPTPTFVSKGQTLSGEIFLPSSGSAWPTVVVAYGTEGMNEPFGAIIRGFCSELASNGFVAFVPDFFSATGTISGFLSVFDLPGAPARFDRWNEVLIDAVTYLQGITNSAAGRTALVGFSLGGQLVLKAAAGHTVSGVVDFFGPLETTGTQITSSLANSLPPVQIHHGEDDAVVRYSDSQMLDNWLNSASVPHELFSYKNNGHPGQELFHPPGWSSAAQSLATTRTVTFLTSRI